MIDLPKELGRIERSLLLLEAENDPDSRRKSSSRYGSSEFDRVKSSYQRQFVGSIEDYRAGRLSDAQLERRLQDAIRDAYPKAYASGLTRWDGATVGARDQAYLNRAISGEAEFARRFAADLKNPQLSDSYVLNRAGMYVDALSSVRTAAWVEHSPDNVMFDWRLGPAIHCSSCLVLATNSPYSKNDLPSYPGDGATQCKSRCRCSLELITAEAPRVKATGAPGLEAPHGVLPDGRVPSAETSSQLDELRSEMNYWRRQVDQATSASDRREAIRERQRVNDELITLQNRTGVRNVPLLSVSEVLGERDLTAEAIEDLIDRGLTSDDLDVLSDQQRTEAMGGFRRAINEFLARRRR